MFNIGKSTDNPTYLIKVDEKNITIYDNDGVCVACSFSKEIGTKVNIQEMVNKHEHVLIDDSDIPKFYLIADTGSTSESTSSALTNLALFSFKQFLHYNNQRHSSFDRIIFELIGKKEQYNIIDNNFIHNLFGTNIEQTKVAVLVSYKIADSPNFEFTESTRTKLVSFFRDMHVNNPVPTATYLGNSKYLIFKIFTNNDSESIKKSIRKQCQSMLESDSAIQSLGLSNINSGDSSFAKCYNEAFSAAEVGPKIWPNAKIFHVSDLGLFQIIFDSNQENNLEFANNVLSPLRKKELIETLKVFFEHNLNLMETARTMSVHRNTIIYRLNQIYDLTKLDPRSLDDAIIFRVALWIDHIFS
jgi:sugar diacid utilization regulator